LLLSPQPFSLLEIKIKKRKKWGAEGSKYVFAKKLFQPLGSYSKRKNLCS